MKGLAPRIALIGLALTSCREAAGPPGHGTLQVSTATGGNAPDPDGYLLSVDDATYVALDPRDSVHLDVSGGSHLLTLRGVAEHCVVTPGAMVQVDVQAESTTAVAFEVGCQATGARVSVVTSGVDLDPNGYGVVVDGTNRGVVRANGTLLILLAPGFRTVVLQGLAPNCRYDASGSATIAVQQGEMVRVDFSVTCVATTGAIGVSVSEGVTEGVYEGRVDGGTPFSVAPFTPAYVLGVTPGEHRVTLAGPPHCVVEAPEQTVVVTVGSTVRDTAHVVFAVTCAPTRLRITAPTSGPIPVESYSVLICDSGWYCYYNGPTFVGNLAPNGSLLVPVHAVPHLAYQLELANVPATCEVQVPNPTAVLTPVAGDTLDVEFPVACSP